MMIEPPIEKMSAKVGNKYKLAVLASKRALELQKEHLEDGVNPEVPELTEAAIEIWNDEVVFDDEKWLRQMNNLPFLYL